MARKKTDADLHLANQPKNTVSGEDGGDVSFSWISAARAISASWRTSHRCFGILGACGQFMRLPLSKQSLYVGGYT